VLRSWPDDGGTRAVLARTNRELLPVVAAAMRLGMPFRAADLALPLESPLVDELLDAAECAEAPGQQSATAGLGRLPERLPRTADAPRLLVGGDEEDPVTDRRAIAEALQAWSAAYASVAALRTAVADARAMLAELRRDDAPLTLATAHGTKGLEFDHVAVIGLDAGRFPSARSIADALEPERAMEEERRLAYVAWTRARRSLTLVYDPGAPSQFLLEAFDPAELGVRAA
jgi:superfamily I DNA/RNA helicase